VTAVALPDESRAYVGAFYTDDAGNICPQVTVINTSGNVVKTSIPVPGFPSFAPYSPPICSTTRFRFSMAAGGDSSRIYLASCDGGMVNIIRTSDDTYVLNLPEPASVRAPIPPSTQPPPQNPVFLLAGP
jgi:DNA-binding beta-propeller fold protein YncE